jgi:DNA-binding transcriptional regulator YdaS (Cro superfamily)
MGFEAYLKRNGSGTLAALSRSLGISKGRLSQLRGKTDWPPELALKAERETSGQLDASKLSSVVAEARRTAA